MSIKIDYGKRHWLTEQEQLDECISLMEKHPLNPIYERHGGFIFESEHETSFRIAFYDMPYTFGFTTCDTKLIALISAIVKSNTGGFSITYRRAQEEIRLNEQLQRSEEYSAFLKKQGAAKVHFKRHGSADWLELQGLNYQHDNYFYIQMHQKSGRLNMEHVITGHVRAEENKYVTGMDYDTLEEHITDFLGFPVQLGRFVESYHIGRAENEHPTDRDIINGIDITGLTVEKVIELTEIKLNEFFKEWHISDIVEKLANPSERILAMKFSKLYRLIHTKNFHAIMAEDAGDM